MVLQLHDHDRRCARLAFDVRRAALGAAVDGRIERLARRAHERAVAVPAPFLRGITSPATDDGVHHARVRAVTAAQFDPGAGGCGVLHANAEVGERSVWAEQDFLDHAVVLLCHTGERGKAK